MFLQNFTFEYFETFLSKLQNWIFERFGTKSTKEILVSNYGSTQGTTYNIRYMSTNAIDYQSDIDSVLHAVDLSMSNYKEESTISKINRNESMKTDSLFILALGS